MLWWTSKGSGRIYERALASAMAESSSVSPVASRRVLVASLLCTTITLSEALCALPIPGPQSLKTDYMALSERHSTRQFDDTLLEDAGPATLHETLADLPPRFFIPRLADKPQNPIMDTLKLMHNSQGVRPANSVSLPIPLELGLLSEDVARFAAEKQAHFDDIWQLAALQKHGHKVRLRMLPISCCLHAVPAESSVIMGCPALNS